MNVARVWAADKIGRHGRKLFEDLLRQRHRERAILSRTTSSLHLQRCRRADGLQLGLVSATAIGFSAAKTDVSTAYHAGAVIQTTVLISDIQTYLNAAGTGTAVSDYKLAYQLGQRARCSADFLANAATARAYASRPRRSDGRRRRAGPPESSSESTPPITAGLTGVWLGVDFNGDGVIDGRGLGDSTHHCASIYEVSAFPWRARHRFGPRRYDRDLSGRHDGNGVPYISEPDRHRWLGSPTMTATDLPTCSTRRARFTTMETDVHAGHVHLSSAAQPENAAELWRAAGWRKAAARRSARCRARPRRITSATAGPPITRAIRPRRTRWIFRRATAMARSP